jgi:MipA family protein
MAAARKAPRGAFFFALALLAGTAHGEPRPQWELGMGATAFSLPDYRGSDERRGYVYPIPYFIYRGEKVRVDRQGVRGVFFESDRVELDFSIYGTPPVDSSNNQARRGMPDLDPTLEIGPLLSVSLWRDRVSERRLDLRLPLRAVIATDLSHAHRAGWVFHPQLSLGMRPRLGDGRWNLGVQTGPLFATSRYHAYFYGVDERFATPDRPAYTARAGYSGWSATAGLSRRYRQFWAGGFVRYDALKGAAFEDSPLVRRQSSVMAGIAFAWVLTESARMVEVSDR